MKDQLIAALRLGCAAAGAWRASAAAADLSDADRAFLVEGAHGAAQELVEGHARHDAAPARPV